MMRNGKPVRRLKDTEQPACCRHGDKREAAVPLKLNFRLSHSARMRLRVGLMAAVCGCLLTPQMALAQQTQPATVLGPQVVPLTAQSVYQGWRAADVLGDKVMTNANDELGTVKNILIRTDGRIEALIVESIGRPNVPEFVYRIPWSKIKEIAHSGKIVADIPIGQRQQLGLDPDKKVGAVSSDEFPVTEVVGDYARLQAGQAYGYVSDVIFTKGGRMLAVLVARDGVAGGGTYAFGFPKEPDGRWSPAAGYYGLPYKTSEQASNAAVRIDTKRIGSDNRSGG